MPGYFDAQGTINPQPISVTGSVTVGGSSGTTTVTGSVAITNTVPVTFGGLSPLSVWNASAVGVSGTVQVWTSGLQGVSGTMGINNFPAFQAISGGVVIQNWPTVVGVSSSFPLQTWIAATVGVSGTVGVNNFPATQNVSGGIVVQNWPVTMGVSSSFPLQVWIASTVGVSGTVGINNFPSVQAVSGVVSIGNWPAVHGVSGTVQVWTSGLQGVSGTVGVNNFPSVQAVSGVVSLGNWPAVHGISGTVQTWTSGLQGISGTVTINATGSIAITTTGSSGLQVSFATIAQPVSMSNSGPVYVLQEVLTKGTQGTRGVTVQNFMDAGRTLQHFCTSSVSGVLGEALFNLQRLSSFTLSGSTTSSFYATNGKTLRLQSAVLMVTTTTGNSGSLFIRMRVTNAAPGTGASVVTAKSPSVWCIGTQVTPVMTSSATQTVFVDFPNGFEVSGQQQFGFTQQATNNTMVFDFNVSGFEY